METRAYTVIETDDSKNQFVHFEWYGGKTVNVVQEIHPTDPQDWPFDEQIDSFTFVEQPTQAQVVKACEGYFS